MNGLCEIYVWNNGKKPPTGRGFLMEAEKGHARFFQKLSRFLPKPVELPKFVEISSYKPVELPKSVRISSKACRDFFQSLSSFQKVSRFLPKSVEISSKTCRDFFQNLPSFRKVSSF